MSRPFTRQQALENQAFLAQLRRTGNAREAARALGAHRAKFTKRRASHPAFAAEWDAALAVAHAALSDPPRHGEGGVAASGDVPGARRSSGAGSQSEPSAKHGGGASATTRTRPADPRILRTRSGRLQLRRTPPGRLTRAAEQAFLAALSATANIRLSAAAAGFSHSAFYQHARRDRGFAREMRLALKTGYERLELALLEGWSAESHRQDAWRHNDPPPIPPMSPDQALMLLQLHARRVDDHDEPPHLKRRRGESKEAYVYRLGVMHEMRLERDREAFRVAEAARQERGERSPYEEGIALADLAQVRRRSVWR